MQGTFCRALNLSTTCLSSPTDHPFAFTFQLFTRTPGAPSNPANCNEE